MAPFEEFESILKEVVAAKKLSASKMSRVTDIAMKSMDNDTQLVSILYRTHKSLPSTSKISSLYVFDALCRAAKHQANKQNLIGDINSSIGNCATFLLKVEGVLEGLIQDMITIGTSEAKEKTKKILDIWMKGNTFPSRILSRLLDVMKETEKVPEMNSSTPSTTPDPRTIAQTPSVITPTQSVAENANPPPDPQATLLALLAQAANAATVPAPVQTTANTGVVDSGLYAKQLAVLQQLALAQTSSAAPSTPTELASNAVHATSESAYPTTSSSFRDETSSTLHKDSRGYDRRHSPERVNTHGDQYDDRKHTRGSFRGGPFRGRGRGDFRRWNDRHGERDRYTERERDRAPEYRGRRSRSRSPPARFGGRRDVRPYSPPRRPSFASSGSRGPRDSPGPGIRDGDKDEFGRDIRPQSPPSDLSKTETVQSPPSSATRADHPDIDPSPISPSNHERILLSPVVATNTSSGTPSASVVSNVVPANAGMENFDPMTFDFTSPSSWEALGKMWQVTHGYMPSAEQLMQFVVSTGQTTMASYSTQENNWSQTQGQVWRGGGRGRGFRGRGGYVNGNGNGRIAQGEWAFNNNDQTTDAIVLGETAKSVNEDVEDSKLSSPTESGNEGPGGRMQRVGDKWVFVRGSAVGIS